MAHTEKQKLQKARSWFKFQLLGIVFKIKDEHLTAMERAILLDVKRNMKALVAEIDNNSRKLGLNVPATKCWCGKAGVFEPNNGTKALYPEVTKVCKAHRG